MQLRHLRATYINSSIKKWWFLPYHTNVWWYITIQIISVNCDNVEGHFFTIQYQPIHSPFICKAMEIVQFRAKSINFCQKLVAFGISLRCVMRYHHSNNFLKLRQCWGIIFLQLNIDPYIAHPCAKQWKSYTWQPHTPFLGKKIVALGISHKCVMKYHHSNNFLKLGQCWGTIFYNSILTHT